MSGLLGQLRHAFQGLYRPQAAKDHLPISASPDGSVILEKPPHSAFDRAFATLFYGFTSISITLFNKAVFSIYKFNYPNTVTTLQILLSIIFIWVLQRLKYMEHIRFSLATAKQVAPLTLCWWVYVVSGVTALRYLNVPMFSTLRRGTTVVVMLGEFTAFQKRPSLGSAAAVLFITAGAVIATGSDLTYSPQGYFYVGLCVISTAAYLILIRLLKDKTGLSEVGLMYYNNLISIPVMLSYLLLATDELQSVRSFPLLHDLKFQIFLLFSASQAFLLNLAIFKCTTVNSPLTTSVTGQVKDIATTILGFTLFGDVIPTLANVTGVAMGLLGGLTYSLLSYLDKTRPKGDKVQKQNS